ncbi:CCA tRNA nucleotidyltransferase [Candidatus Woesearchaeota archaeon]|nr:CCA tRNA nucleotidyltransferase [Candidatus Woesearchaeota archaeon]
MKETLKHVLAKIKPSEKEEQEVKRIANKILGRIKIKDAKPVLGGSGEKGTWLRGTHDIDVYVKFSPKKYENGEISKVLRKSLTRSFGKVDTLHGSRDYYQIKQYGYTVEIVPIINIKKVSEAQNITDISPFHAEWVKKHKKGDEIRLAKAFCRANNCYGAESHIQGFSGYVLEILVIHYGSFSGFIRHVSKWKPKERLDPAKHGVQLNEAKTHSPLILIDPVQNDRNAAAALSKDKYNKLIKAAQNFLKKPSEDAFIKKDITLDDIRKKAEGKKLVRLEITPLEGKEDVIGAKLLKSFEFIRKQLALEGFKVHSCDWKWDGKADFWFITEKEDLSGFKEHKGPKLSQEKHVKKFKEKNKDYEIYQKNGRIYSKTPRDYRNPEQFIKHLLTLENLKKKFIDIQLLWETP